MNFLNRFKSARESHLTTVLIVGIVLLINFVASNHFVRIDLTSNRIYELSSVSKEIVRDLDDIVSVRVYFSHKLPPHLFAVRQYVGDVLDELSSYSDGNLHVRYLNPADPDISAAADEIGIPQVRMNIVEKDKIEVKNGYLGISVVYGDRTEILPVVQDRLNVEYDLVAAIKKVTADETRRIAYLTGHNQPTLDSQIGVGQLNSSYSLIREAMERNYEVESVNLLQGDSLDSFSTLLVAGIKTELSGDEQAAITQFLLDGGNVLMLVDPIRVDGELQAKVQNLALNEFLATYGLQLNNQLVLDDLNERASFSEGALDFVLDYPFWVKASKENLAADNPVVSHVDSIVFPWASPITLLDDQPTALVKTSLDAWLEDAINLDPSLVQSFNQKDQYTLAALTSLNEGGRLILVSNARFVYDRYIQQFDQNLNFFMNMVDYLTLDDSLIEIRSKSSYELPLKTLSLNERQLVKWIGIVLMPLLVVVYGIYRYFHLRKVKFKL